MQFLKECFWSVEDWYRTYYGWGWRPALRFVLELAVMALIVFALSWLCGIE